MDTDLDELPDDLRAWAELLARHHRSLRRPYATGGLKLMPADESSDGDGDSRAGYLFLLDGR